MFSPSQHDAIIGPSPRTRDTPEKAGGTAHAKILLWESDQDVAARRAIDGLVNFFPKSLACNERLHVETLYCVIGALAGFAVQHAVRQENVASGKATEAEVFAIAQGADGQRYYFGDRINALLVPASLGSIAIWSILAGEALRLGADMADLPDCPEISERTARSIGTAGFGIPELPPNHKPALTPRRAIEIFWPAISNGFSRAPATPVAEFKLLAPRYWPLALATVAASYMPKTTPPLAPALAVKIFMEAAIPMSKIDQGAVQFVGATKH